MAPRSHRSVLLALVFVLASLALPAAAAAQSNGSALAQERYYHSYGQTARPVGQGQNSALAQERYYGSYGSPTLIRAAAPLPSDGPDWTIAVVGGVALLLAGVAFGVFGSRAIVRPRGASA
jgi:hypothetical protein